MTYLAAARFEELSSMLEVRRGLVVPSLATRVGPHHLQAHRPRGDEEACTPEERSATLKVQGLVFFVICLKKNFGLNGCTISCNTSSSSSSKKKKHFF